MNKKLRRILCCMKGENPDKPAPQPKVIIHETIIMVPEGAERVPVFCLEKRSVIGGGSTDTRYVLDINLALEWKRDNPHYREITVIEAFKDRNGDVYVAANSRKLLISKEVPLT